MNILIFGATGFIGKELTYKLKDNYNITVISRNLAKADKYFHEPVQKIELDYSNTGLLSEIISQHDIIINLAGENIASKIWTKKQKRRILDSRIKVGSFIEEGISKAQNKPQLLVQASAVGYYGYEASENCNEKSPKGNGFLADVSEKWEKPTENVEELGVRRVVLRTGVVLGKNGGMLPKIATPIKYFIGTNFGQGKNYISWIHIEDEIRAIEFLIKNKESNGIYNLTSPEPVQLKELNKQIGKALNRPVWFNIPSSIIKFFFGSMANELLLANQKAVPEKLLNEGFYFKFRTIEEALNSLLSK